jgi:hypothetical protein
MRQIVIGEVGIRRTLRRWRCQARRAGVGVALAVVVLATGGGIALASHRTVTRGEAHAVATAINLRHADLPGLKEESNSVSAVDRRLDAQLTACVGEAPPSEAFAAVSSPSFAGPAPSLVTVSSQTQIFPSASVVDHDLAAGRRPRALTCLAAYAGSASRAVVAKDVTVSTHAAWLPTAVSGTDGVSGVRITVVLGETQGTTTEKVAVYIDAIGFVYGQAEVSLSVTSTSTAPSRSLERRLEALLVARAQASIG